MSNWNDLTGAQQGNILKGVGGAVSGILGGVIGGRKRRQEQSQAREALKQQMAEYKNFKFENAFAAMENPFEDLTVNTQQAEFQAQQQQQGMANTLDQLRQGGGGMGAAALAQALVGQQRQGMQQISASIGLQESANARMAAQGEARMQMAEAKGAMDVQQSEFGRTQTLLDMSATRKNAADAARAQATQSFVGGIGNLAGAAFGAASAGLFKG